MLYFNGTINEFEIPTIVNLHRYFKHAIFVYTCIHVGIRWVRHLALAIDRHVYFSPPPPQKPPPPQRPGGAAGDGDLRAGQHLLPGGPGDGRTPRFLRRGPGTCLEHLLCSC